jgi:hypothetical protein
MTWLKHIKHSHHHGGHLLDVLACLHTLQVRATKVTLNAVWTKQMVGAAGHAQAAASALPLDAACSVISITLPGGAEVTTILDMAADWPSSDGDTAGPITAAVAARDGPESKDVPSCSSLSKSQDSLPAPCRMSNIFSSDAGQVRANAAVKPFVPVSFGWHGEIAGEREDSMVTLAAVKDEEGNLEWSGSFRSIRHGVFKLYGSPDNRDDYFMVELDEAHIKAEPRQYEPPPPTLAAINATTTAGDDAVEATEAASHGRRLLLDEPPRPSNEMDPIGERVGAALC